MNAATKEKMSLSPVELADELSMTSDQYLVVEGRSDKLSWEHLQKEGLKLRKIRIANKKDCSGNKEYVKCVMKLMNKRKKKNVIGIVDLDYDYVTEKVEIVDNLFYYKYIDLENVLIQSSTLKEINKMISSSEKKLDENELKKFLYEKVYVLGLLRLLNEIEGCGFDFQNVDYKKLLKGDQQEFLNYFLAKMQLNADNKKYILEEMKQLSLKEYDEKYICNGHDLMKLLSLMTNKIIATDNPIVYKEEVLENMFLLGYRYKMDKTDVKECEDIIFT